MADTSKESQNMVHKNAILAETVAKENRLQKLYTNYSINPHKKFFFIAEKPNKAVLESDEDPYFRQVFERSHQEPTKKYKRPQTESQEYGWISTPLIKTDRGDTRLNHFHQSCDFTKFMDKAWLAKHGPTK